METRYEVVQSATPGNDYQVLVRLINSWFIYSNRADSQLALTKHRPLLVAARLEDD